MLNKEDLYPGMYVKHTDSGSIERILCIGKQKQQDGTWVESVFYAGVDRNTGEESYFSRPIDSFMQSFEPLSLFDEEADDFDYDKVNQENPMHICQAELVPTRNVDKVRFTNHFYSPILVNELDRYKESCLSKWNDGFDIKETWNLDSVICRFIAARIRAFIDRKPVGYPGDLRIKLAEDGITGVTEDSLYTYWMDILEKIYFWASHYEHESFMYDTDENRKIFNIPESEKEMTGSDMKRRRDEGFDLFCKYFYSLWD